MLKLKRRKFLMAFILFTIFVNAPVLAKDGDSDNDDSSDNSGSGSDNSGSGKNNDDDDDLDDDKDEVESGSTKNDQSRALKAVKDGKAVPLHKLKLFLSHSYPGKLLKVSLEKKSGKYVYRVRILSKGNRIKNISLNALTLKPGTN